jgi:hypothetical protein
VLFGQPTKIKQTQKKKKKENRWTRSGVFLSIRGCRSVAPAAIVALFDFYK